MNELSPRAVAAPRATRAIRVVVVDDSPLARAALVSLLSLYFHMRIAGEAENGQDGLSLAARLKPDLVITDLRMPGLDGFGFVELLRRQCPAVKTILTSDDDCATLQATSLRRGANAFVTKQHLPGELPGLLKRLFPDAHKEVCANANDDP